MDPSPFYGPVIVDGIASVRLSLVIIRRKHIALPRIRLGPQPG